MNISTEPVLVHYKITKLAVVFALVGTMMIVVPMLIGHAQAFTVGVARVTTGGFHFTNLKWHLDRGQWVHKPKIVAGTTIDWETRGRSGPEKGTVAADLTSVLTGKVIGQARFFWSNPLFVKNSCDTVTSSSNPDFRVSSFPCHITSGNFATATYQVNVREID